MCKCCALKSLLCWLASAVLNCAGCGLQLAKEGGSSSASGTSRPRASPAGTALVRAPQRGLDLSDTMKDAAKLLLLDEKLRRQVGWL
jgi:hypothetical protein